MAASGDDSTITTLSNSGCFKNYGSVQKTALTSGTLEHPVQATDTIEGIAIKYGVSVSGFLCGYNYSVPNTIEMTFYLCQITR